VQWLHTTGVAAALAKDLTLAGYEALANVVEHAYPPDHPHQVMRLQAQVSLPCCGSPSPTMVAAARPPRIRVTLAATCLLCVQ